MDVTKVVDLVTRIPENLSLYFSDFSTNLYRFYKFSGKTRKHIHRFAKGPLGCFGGLQNGPWPEYRGRGGLAGRFPATAVAGGEGGDGEGLE